MKEQIDIFDDLLIEFDEMGFVPTTAVPDHEAYAIDWKNRLINALEGYRKQSEGEWREDVVAFCNVCSSCRAMVDRYAIKCNSGKLHYCPNCGAKMKGAGDEKSMD